MRNIAKFFYSCLLDLLLQERGKDHWEACKNKVSNLKFLIGQKKLCLRYTDQTKPPDTEEKMKLTQMGLGFKEMKFDTDGDALHIHSVILGSYPELDFCGGYILMRLGSGSSELVTIEPPRGGLNVISAKLFIRPLQRDIEERDDGQDTVHVSKTSSIHLSFCSDVYALFT